MSSRLAERSNLYYTLLSPPLHPLVLDAVKRRLARHGGGGRLSAARVGVHEPSVAAARCLPRLDSGPAGRGYHRRDRGAAVAGEPEPGARDRARTWKYWSKG